MSEHSSENHGAVIVCDHVINGEPVLLAERSAPAAAEDTGWQFLCGGDLEESIKDAQVWSMEEALKLEPSLREHIGAPYGTRLTRSSQFSPWVRSHQPHRYDPGK